MKYYKSEYSEKLIKIKVEEEIALFKKLQSTDVNS